MPGWSTFVERFHATAREHSQRPALCATTGVLSYGDLLEQAATLAEAFKQHGIGRGSIVALALGRCSEHIIGMLASWWVGAAFVPLDRHWPDERLRFILQETTPAGVVAWPHQVERFRNMGVRCIEAIGALVSDASQKRSLRRDREERFCEASLTKAFPSDLAYIVYTSGSTGSPKGVAIEHRGIVVLMDAQIAAFGLRPDSRALWLLNPAFDASLSDIGTVLLSGGALHIAPDENPLDPTSLVRLLHQHQITHVDLPPALLGVHEPRMLPSTLQTVIIGGEPSPPALVRHWARSVRVVNVYGPTEATVCTSLCPCHPDTWQQSLLGQPLPHVRYRVLDSNLDPVPRGGTGELCIGGSSLARGYINRPDLTSAKFIMHQGERLYRTGDLVLWRLDGEYVFLGRVDRQVKVRGQLVEPEEIEARLREHPHIRQAAVVKRPLGPAPAAQGLAAFIVADAVSAAALELPAFLAACLPAWMVPQRIVLVPRLPLTTSGKVDLQRLVEQPLPALSAGEQDIADDTVAILAGIWGQLLGMSAVDLDAGFLEQGGDSLTLLQAVAAATARGLHVPPALLAEGLGINAIVAWLRGGQMVPGAMSCVDLRAEVETILVGLPLQPAGDTGKSPPDTILLTGATGLLGSSLLAGLLRRTGAEIICLVRADNGSHGLARLHQALPGRLDRACLERVRVIIGDVAQPYFGLTVAAWTDLARRVDAVYHCAAGVNILLPWAELRRGNVIGTAEVLRFATAQRVKCLHHASTLSVFVATDNNTGRLMESDHLETTRWVHGGYAQSKWAAEWLLRLAGSQVPGPIAHYRFGLLTGTAARAAPSARDFLTLFIQGMAQLRCLPPLDQDALFLDVTPTDFAAAAMAHLSLHGVTGDGATFHIANPRSLSLREIVTALAEAGVRVQEVSTVRWRTRLAELERSAPEGAAACLALCRGLPGTETFVRYRTLDLFQATNVQFDMRQTFAGLAGSGIVCPPPGPDLIRECVTAALGT